MVEPGKKHHYAVAPKWNRKLHHRAGGSGQTPRQQAQVHRTNVRKRTAVTLRKGLEVNQKRKRARQKRTDQKEGLSSQIAIHME